MSTTAAHKELVGEVRLLKARLLNALTEADFVEVRSVLQSLWRVEMTVGVLQETKIASTLTDARKATKRAKLNDLFAAAKDIIASWKGLYSAPNTARPTRVHAAALDDHPAPTKRRHVQEGGSATSEAALTNVISRSPSPPATVEFSTFSRDRRWKGVDGAVGPDSHWSSWSQPIPLAVGYVAGSGNPTVAGPYIVPV
eukprot:m.248155 g.248155  ORF g.248155 m.248155 type:complete len:198 (-) comp26470_c4_seq5:2143-2736(-)